MHPLLRACQLTVRRARSCQRPLNRMRRGLHHDANGSGFFDMPLQGHIGIGMDMTRAPGYRLSAEVAPPPSHDRLLANFAARHARLSPAQVYHADGFLWVGPVIPSVVTRMTEESYENRRAWDSEDAREALSQLISEVMEDEAEEAESKCEASSDALGEVKQGRERKIRASGNAPRRRRTVGGFRRSRYSIYAKRRYSGGQARRERARREQSESRRQARTDLRKKTNRPPLRKPYNHYLDISAEGS